jgi:hypothetical protein
MLNIPFGRVRFCDGISRRNFLKVGSFTFGAASLTLADIMRAEAAAGTQDLPRTGHKAIINIFLGGGPPHQDMWEIKTEAPAEIRGEFKPISTKVPGIQIGECFPRIAKSADKYAFIRSVIGARGGHDAFQCTTGWPQQSLASMGGRPSIGSVATKLQGSVDASVPPFIGMAEKTQHVPWSDPGQVGFLGSTFGPFKPSGPVSRPAQRSHLALPCLAPPRPTSTCREAPRDVYFIHSSILRWMVPASAILSTLDSSVLAVCTEADWRNMPSCARLTR